jgi:hypothetical protein
MAQEQIAKTRLGGGQKLFIGPLENSFNVHDCSAS